MNRYLCLGLLSTLILGGCKGSDPATKAEAAPATDSAPATPTKEEPKPIPVEMPANLKHSGYEYYGLATSSTLTFEVVDATGTKREGTQRVELVSATPDKAEFKIEREGMLVTGPSTETVEVTREGVFVSKSSQGDFKKPTMELPFDLAIGKGWEVKSEMEMGSQTIQINAIGKAEAAEAVTTPAGKFETVRVSLTGEMSMGTTKAKIKGKSWYASGVGMVKQEVTNESGGKAATIKIQLVKK